MACERCGGECADAVDCALRIASQAVVIWNDNPIKFCAADRVDFEGYLASTRSLLDSLWLTWGFAFGTALGLYREKSYIPGDTDIDVMILADGIDIESVKSLFGQHLDLIRYVKVGDRYHQLAFQGDDKFIVDLCFFYRDGSDWVSECEGGHWRDDVSVIGGFKDYETEHGLMPLPEKVEDYLESRYGDWWIKKYGLQACSRKESA